MFLGRASLWTDEGDTWVQSVQPISNIIKNSWHVDVMFLPYYLLMHFWVEASQSAWWMRLPSLLMGAAAVAALALLARRWLPPVWSVVAGLLLALNPLFVQWTIEARPYAAATLFAVLSTAALVTAIHRPSALRWVRYGLASLCMLLLHLLAVFVLVAQLIGVAVARRRPAWRGMATTLACVAVAVSPLAVVAAGETTLISWVPPSTLRTFFSAVGDISGGPAEGAGLVICGIVLAAIIASSPAGSEEALSSALCLTWGALPPLLLVLVGFLHPLFVDRYTLVCIPGIALIEAMAGCRAWTVLTALGRTRGTSGPEMKAAAPVGSVDRHYRRRRTSIVAAIALGGAGVGGLALLASKTSQVLQERYYSDDYRSAAAALSSDLLKRPASILITPNWAGVGFSYYAAPPALAHALGEQATQALDQDRIDWQEVTLGPDDSLPDSSLFRWPLGAERETPTAGCVLGWAIGRGIAPSTTFIVDGSRCRLSHVHYYGEVWVGSAGG
jgi:mannosyltransferase